MGQCETLTSCQQYQNSKRKMKIRKANRDRLHNYLKYDSYIWRCHCIHNEVYLLGYILVARSDENGKEVKNVVIKCELKCAVEKNLRKRTLSSIDLAVPYFRLFAEAYESLACLLSTLKHLFTSAWKRSLTTRVSFTVLAYLLRRVTSS